MAEIKLILSDEGLATVVEAYRKTQGYAAQIADKAGKIIKNPESQEDFTKRMIIKQINSTVKLCARKEARDGVDNSTIDIT